MYALRLPSLDPAFNLAFEEHLFRSLSPDHPGWLLLWQNGPSIIVGRHQNTAAEVNPDFVKERSLSVVRRMSGGGAVYHDQGNLNFSFLTPLRPGSPAPGFAAFLQPVVEALGTLGIKAEISGRNDLVVSGGGKCSGSAQLRSSGGILHHGTFLVDVNMDNLSLALAGDPEKYRSKGLASMRSRVANLAPLLGLAEQGAPCATPEDRAEAVNRIAEAVLARFGLEPLAPNPELIAAAAHLADARYRTWEWNYGRSPAFSERRVKRFPWGRVECCFDVQDGEIRECRFYGDFFAQEDTGKLEIALRGVSRRPDLLRGKLQEHPLQQYFSGCDREELLDFLTGENQ